MKRPSVQDVRVIKARGPWDTKSGGKLMVTMETSLATLQNTYLHYEPEEIDRIPIDIRGLRIYYIKGLSKGRIGGTEWHRIRKEIVFVLKGSVRWTCEDLHGVKKDFILDPGVGVWVPPFILHTYKVRKARSELLVIANTLFDPEKPATHDTYSAKTFHELRAEEMQRVEESLFRI